MAEEKPCFHTHGGSPVYLHHIGYSAETVASCEPGFQLLDNSANLRPDWCEYWPMRGYLLGRRLDENAYYGFFSPRFREKTFLDRDKVAAFVASRQADVYTFSPQPDIGGMFLNVFAGGEFVDPGFLSTSQKFVRACGLDVNLATLVMDSRTVVHSNYFLARPDFWRAWLAVNEKLFAFGEGVVPCDFREELVFATKYEGGVERKVFLMERVASLVLALGKWTIAPCDPFVMGWSTQLSQHWFDAIICDALKVAYRELGHAEYLHVFNEMRRRIFGEGR